MKQDLYVLHASICQTLSNPRRLAAIDQLREGERTVGELMQAMNIAQANLSQHLAIMRQKGIVVGRREGANVYYRLSNPKIIQACDLMREVLLENLRAGVELAQSVRG